MVADTFDSRWKNPSGATPQELYLWAQNLIKELRGGGFVNALGLMDTEGAQDAVGSILSDAGDIDFTYDDATPAITAAIKSDAVTTIKILNDNVTYAKLQNVSVTDRLLGRDTAGAGDAEELTLSQALDFIGSAAQGDVLYRGAANWARLGAGTSGQFLQTLGAAANLQWASGIRLLAASAAGSAAHTGDTTETTLATITVPAGSMGANGILRITTQWRLTGAGGNRTARVRFNGTEFTGLGTAASSLSMRTQTQIANRNATNSQVGSAATQANWTGTAADVVTSAHDTTGALDITLTGQLANAGDSIQVSGYLVELIVP